MWPTCLDVFFFFFFLSLLFLEKTRSCHGCQFCGVLSDSKSSSCAQELLNLSIFASPSRKSAHPCHTQGGGFEMTSLYYVSHWKRKKKQQQISDVIHIWNSLHVPFFLFLFLFCLIFQGTPERQRWPTINNKRKRHQGLCGSNHVLYTSYCTLLPQISLLITSSDCSLSE